MCAHACANNFNNYLRDIIHVIQFTHLKSTIQLFFVYVDTRNSQFFQCGNFFFLSPQKETLYPLAITTPTPHAPPPARSNHPSILCLWISLFWTFPRGFDEQEVFFFSCPGSESVMRAPGTSSPFPQGAWSNTWKSQAPVIT